jgi:hypothetical protein
LLTIKDTTMKYILKISLVLVALAFTMNSCVKPDDLMTSNAKEGGLVIPTPNLLMSTGKGQVLTVDVEIPIGPGIESLELNKSYNQGDTLLSNEVVLSTVSVGQTNASDTANISYTLDYAALKADLIINGAEMPVNDVDLGVGDRWTITYTSIMADGRRVLNNATTVVAVSNKYAGTYHVVGVFTHPVNGPRDIDEDKFLSPVSKTKCWTTVGDLGEGTEMYITIDPVTFECTVAPGPNPGTIGPVAIIPATTNVYDPVAGTLELNYQYIGATGARVMHEVYTPLAK